MQRLHRKATHGKVEFLQIRANFALKIRRRRSREGHNHQLLTRM